MPINNRCCYCGTPLPDSTGAPHACPRFTAAQSPPITPPMTVLVGGEYAPDNALLTHQMHGYRLECEELREENSKLRARIKALESAQGARVPEGYVLVPKEPTKAMIRAVKKFARIDSHGEFIPMRAVPDVCRAVLAAAPPAPSAPSREPMTDADALYRIRQHIGWLKMYAEGMEQSDWRDMRDRITTQLAGLSADVGALTEVSRIGGASVTDEMVRRFEQRYGETWHVRNSKDAIRQSLEYALGQEKG